VDPRTGLDDEKQRKILPLPGLELRPLACPARSQSPCRLGYPGKPYIHINIHSLHSNLTLKIEAACTSETLVTLPTSTDFRDPGVESPSIMNHRDKLKSVMTLYSMSAIKN
jgi:hypothetical protein